MKSSLKIGSHLANHVNNGCLMMMGQGSEVVKLNKEALLDLTLYRQGMITNNIACWCNYQLSISAMSATVFSCRILTDSALRSYDEAILFSQLAGSPIGLIGANSFLSHPLRNGNKTNY